MTSNTSEGARSIYGFVLFMLALLLLLPYLTPPAPVCCSALFIGAWVVLIVIDIWGIIDGFLPRLENFKEIGYVIILPIVILSALGFVLIPNQIIPLTIGIGVIVLLKIVYLLIVGWRRKMGTW